MLPISRVSSSTSNVPKTLTARQVEFDMINITSGTSHAEANLRHLLGALFIQTHGFSSFILKDRFRQKFNKEISLTKLKELLHLPGSGGGIHSNTQITVSDPVNWVFNEACRIASDLRQDEVSSGEILVALLKLFDKQIEGIQPKIQGKDETGKFFHHQAEKQSIQVNYSNEIDLLKSLLDGLDSEKVKSYLKSQYDKFHMYRR